VLPRYGHLKKAELISLYSFFGNGREHPYNIGIDDANYVSRCNYSYLLVYRSTTYFHSLKNTCLRLMKNCNLPKMVCFPSSH